jgi:hypothetical protein
VLTRYSTGVGLTGTSHLSDNQQQRKPWGVVSADDQPNHWGGLYRRDPSLIIQHFQSFSISSTSCSKCHQRRFANPPSIGRRGLVQNSVRSNWRKRCTSCHQLDRNVVVFQPFRATATTDPSPLGSATGTHLQPTTSRSSLSFQVGVLHGISIM